MLNINQNIILSCPGSNSDRGGISHESRKPQLSIRLGFSVFHPPAPLNFLQCPGCGEQDKDFVLVYDDDLNPCLSRGVTGEPRLKDNILLYALVSGARNGEKSGKCRRLWKRRSGFVTR